MKLQDTVSNPCLEALEPRLLLSTSGLGEPEAFDSPEIPAYINVDLPERPEDDSVSPCLRQAHADIEAGGAGVIRIGSLEIGLPRGNEAGELQVYVHVDAVNADIIGALEGAGLRLETSNARMKVVQGWLPHTNLDLAAAVEGVCRITPPAYGVTNSGSVMTEGDEDLQADHLRDPTLFDPAAGAAGHRHPPWHVMRAGLRTRRARHPPRGGYGDPPRPLERARLRLSARMLPRARAGAHRSIHLSLAAHRR